MNQDVSNPRQLAFHSRTHVPAYRVGCGDRQRRINFDVQVDVILQACLSCEHLIDTLNSRDGSRYLHNLASQLWLRHGVYEFERRVPQNAKAGDDDHDADDESSVVISG